MRLKVNGMEIAAYPSSFTVTTMDLDDGESSVRTADGTLNRDRIAVKRQIEMSWGPLKWQQISALLKSMDGVFFDFTYPDPMTGSYETKKMYVGNRPAPFTVEQGNEIMWSGLKVTLTER
ncbi:hypothetical protein WJ0W_004081 [Paenibacillus melissococcoides]|uniref:Prophage protein n=1 Tax=Paenibacillus melissococcoides TaxID=2912268 RepID=A0ABM9G6K9_9BACL|nr:MULTISPECIES: DUF6711 family protein [Paenibacillus]GIO81929.1 hypothetical protein J6TS7_55390 [Paenibacillus dendritiformis]CAH8246849.1 hypothetical protein WJ0W_004081 [Paenibacillus melissococcoides]CAH8715942.1 hypothetical protein HTL2_004451 [Paenibacillus melissococcoides]CAH8716896.1 hypothetical protein WDD9_004718 [Paenibacillus melissococcoides]